MVTGTHPDDIDLFDYVEGDLPAGRRAQLEVHLASCAQCAEQVARVTAGREALRSSQFLQLPPRRREGVFLHLPEQRRERGRSPALSPKRLLAVLTPIAVVAAVVVALVSSGGLGTGTEAQQAGKTLGQVEDQGSAASGGAEAATAPFRAALKAGPPSDVAAELRSKGFDARVVGNHVEVRNATRKQVAHALAGRAAGSVEIVIVR